jgi:hypothetical protein
MANKVIIGLRRFNDFKDELLIELSSFFLMLGFVAGTVDILSSQFGLSGAQWFNVAWSVVQAVAIDGLFFAVWARVRDTPWATQRARKLWYGFIGVLLAVVASLVNNILSFQELNHIVVVADAMGLLGINQAAFSYTRSFLVVIVSILVATFPRDEQQSAEQQSEAQEEQDTSQELQELRGMVEELRGIVCSGLQVATQVVVNEEQSTPLMVAAPVDHEENIVDHGIDQEECIVDQTIEITQAMPASFLASDDQARSYREQIKQAMIEARDNGESLRYQDIASSLGCSLGVVKKHGPSIKQEIGI